MFNGYNSRVITPCVGQCGLNDDDICSGCYRSKKEISDWFDKTDDEKIAIVIRCKKQIEMKTSSH
ncbi:MAG: DUF1289 domain-containing protein [Colwelliaceae bacterium]|jgi:predicted Fe-S protein YdhL (DUF1289 family)|nr:DUF1289 domain-containing protein [Colwelliaceae bacterium]